MNPLALLGGEPVRNKAFSPWPQFLESDVARVIEVVRSRHWGGYPLPSRLAGEFAERFTGMHDARYGLCLTNGTIALVVALQAAGIRYGDEVIVPAYTWDGTAAAVLFAGAVPVFADVDPDTYCLDVHAAENAVTSRTRAIIPVHLAMRFVEMEPLLEIARKYNLRVIEDCAHAHGGQYRGRGAGSMGDAGCFSFQESKLMTSGEGGMLITSHLDVYEAAQSIVNCGRASLTNLYQKRFLGSNYRMTELQAALLMGQLEMWPELAARRSENARLLTRLLSPIEGIRPLPPQESMTRDFYYNFVFQYQPVQPAPPRDLFVAALEAEGVPCEGRFYEPVYRSDLFYTDPEVCPQLRFLRERPVDYSACQCPVAERAAYQESVWLPQTVLIGDSQDVRDVAEAVAKIMGQRETLTQADPALAGLKAMSRHERPRLERQKNY